jgi:hypothetical protein
MNDETIVIPEKILLGDENDALRTRAYIRAMTEPVQKLLNVAGDAKSMKSLKHSGVLTGVLYLAPAQESGIEICPARTPGCTNDCLYLSGHGFVRKIQEGRLRKTYQFLYRKEEFMTELMRETILLHKNAKKKGLVPAVRLNGTSDVRWENIRVGNIYNIFYACEYMQFFDYTKLFDRLGTIDDMDNYHLTFSYAETTHNRINAERAVELGNNVAVVFNELPKTFSVNGKALKVIDGDITDVRFWDVYDEPVVVGLRAKGRAIRDATTGFVVR